MIDIAGDDDAAAVMEIIEDVFEGGLFAESAPIFCSKFVINRGRESGDATGCGFELDADGDKEVLACSDICVFTRPV